ncbi:MAG: hypothetical protein QMB62_12365, partial [Oscillospiraceae bacterium]
MGLDFVRTLLISLGLTIVLELIFAYSFKIRGKSELILVVVVNVITNPAVVLLNNLLQRRTELPRVTVVLILEAAAVLVEGLYYKRYAKTIKKPLLFSLG